MAAAREPAGFWPEILAGACCALLFALWRVGYPATPAAMIAPLAAFLLVGAGIWQRRIRLVLALRESVFLPQSRYKHWFTGRISGAILAVVEAGAITLGVFHFALGAHGAELLLAAALGLCTLAAVAALRRIAARELRPEFAVSASAWVAAGVALPFCLVHFWMQQNILPPPAYLDAGSFAQVLNAALQELPARRDGMIEALSALQLLEAAIRWMLKSLNGIWGGAALLFVYNALIFMAIGRFFGDIATTFNLVRLRA